MPSTITFPRYSFIQGANLDMGDCYTDTAPCLPLSANTNIQFACDIDGTDIDWLMSKYDSSTDSLILYAAVVHPQYNCLSVTEDYTSTPGLHPLFEPHQYFLIADYTLTHLSTGHIKAFFGEVSGPNDLAQLTTGANGYVPAQGDCFKLCLFWEIIRDTSGVLSIPYRIKIGCTNCFRRTQASDCFTSVISYSDPVNSFDFQYQISTGSSAITTQNTVELPMYLRDPIMNDDTKVYTRSDGSIVKLYERKEEQYILETDLMPYTWLKALDIALSHDSVSIRNINAAAYDSINTAQSFQKKENFDIEYQKGALTALGKGSCKLLNANPVHLYNNNCG